MCAAKFERSGFAFRSVCKHFAHEQSTNLAQSANESGFIRKNSGRDNVSTAALRPAASQVPRQQRSSVFPPRGCTFRHQHRVARLPPSPRHVAADFLQAQTSARSCSTSSVAVEDRFDSLAVIANKDDQKDDRFRSGISIDELVQIATEKYQLNADFWGKYTDIPSMAQASTKEDILQIIDNFVLIHRKHVYLFQKLKNTVLKNLALWSAPDLAALCHSWAQLGFLREDLCVAMAARVTATVHTCNAQELCWLMDAYATARCSVHSVIDKLVKQTFVLIDDFTLQQLCLHASSFARLNMQHEDLFRAFASRIAESTPEQHHPQDWIFSARDLTLAAYSFAKLGFCFPEVFSVIAKHAQEVIRDFTARDLQMLVVAFARAQYGNPELLEALSMQAHRRIAQFSAESLTLTLRALSFFNVKDTGLFTRAVAQLPRMILTFRPADVTTLLSAFAAVQVHSEALFDVVTPYILEKAPMLTASDWLSALRSYSALGCRDVMFLYAMTLHLEASHLSLRQLSSAMVDCSRLSFSGHSELLSKAVAAKLGDEDCTASACPADDVAQIYSALILLGHSVADLDRGSAIVGVLRELALRLRAESAVEALSPAARVNLCYAMVLAPPPRGCDQHPMETATLLERCMSETETMVHEERILLRHALRTLELVPWNRRALRGAGADALLSSIIAEEDESLTPPAPFFITALSQLTPLPSHNHWSQTSSSMIDSVFRVRAESGSDWFSSRELKWKGVFVAKEIHAALDELSQALTTAGYENRIVADCDTEAHVFLPRSAALASSSSAVAPGLKPSLEKDIALMWGSTVHYAWGGESDGDVQPQLSPSAKFQAALLQALHDVEVVIVPHWWWRQDAHTEDRGRRLVRFILHSEERSAARLLAADSQISRSVRRRPSNT